MDNLETLLDRWRTADVVDAATAERIRTFESQREPKRSIAVILAVAFGCVMVAAGVLLFVAAHWDNLTPTQRFTLTLTLVAAFHIGGVIFDTRSKYLSIALHMIGTIALGAGIFLAGQIFHLEEHWPGGIMLWTIGAAIAWWLLRDWAQGLLVAILLPFWLIGEWQVRVSDAYHRAEYLEPLFVLALALVYLGAVRHAEKDPLRRGLMWIGGLAFLPAVIITSYESWERIWWRYNPQPVPRLTLIIGWIAALGLPLLVGSLIRPDQITRYIGAVGWAGILVLVNMSADPEKNLLLYLWCLIGSIAMIWWGVDDRRKERINLGMAGFAITLLGFYFSSVLDKFGRSTALIAMGLIFLVGGYYMERLRRRLIAQVVGGAR
jgi:uncharacterized membrane protein